MGYTFWETVAGHELAYALERSLPNIAEALKELTGRKEQYLIVAENTETKALKERIDKELESGSRLVNTIRADKDDTSIILVFERTK